MLKSLFRLKQPLAACIALSTWLEPGLDWEVACCFSPKEDTVVSWHMGRAAYLSCTLGAFCLPVIARATCSHARSVRFSVQVSQPAVKQMRVFLGHGTADPLIPLLLANNSASLLRQKGGPVHRVHACPVMPYQITCSPSKGQPVADSMTR